MDVKVLAVNFYIPLNDTTATPTGEKINMKPNRFKKKDVFDQILYSQPQSFLRRYLI